MGRDDTHELYTPLTTMREIILILFFFFLCTSIYDVSDLWTRALRRPILCEEVCIDIVDISHPRVLKTVDVLLWWTRDGVMSTETLNAEVLALRRQNPLLDIVSIFFDAPMTVYLAADVLIHVIELSTNITTQWEQTRFLHVCSKSLSVTPNKRKSPYLDQPTRFYTNTSR